MRSPCVSSPKAASNGDARMNQKPTPVASGRPSVALNSPKWRTRPSMLPNTTSPVVGSSPPVGSDQKRVPFSPGTRTNSNTTKITTPVKSFLNSNITPRSSSRKARKGSTSSTPNDSPNVTPRNSRPSSMIEPQDKLSEDHSIRGMGQGIRKINTGGISKASSVVSDSQKSHCPLRSSSRERNNYGNATNPGSESQPKFFHADDIRPTLQTIASERFILEGKKSGAKSGRLKENHSSETSNQDSILTLQARRPKFCYADGTSDSPTVPLQLATRPTIRSPTIATQQVKRATSPLKDEILSRESSLSMPSSSPHTRNVSNATAACGQDIRRAEPLSVGHLNTSRRSSVSTLSQQRVRHAKSSSVSAVSSLSRRRPSTELSDVPCIDSPRSHPAADNRTPVQARAPSPSLSDSLYSKSATTFLLSPKLSPNKLEHANELAADARRERKVLDLEISNSSLLAINQTLEREMRKQLAELRRFRRQSQFGRTSDPQSLRSGSKKIGVLSEIDASSNRSRLAGHSLTPLSIEDEYDEDGDDKDSPSKLSFSSSNSLSDDCPIPTSHAALQDSKRLYLDYSRHRALLIDGQKLNQSIERCLGRSEDLIVAGKKALAYRVDVHELESLTGRVLLPDELEETGMWGPGQGLLSPGTGQREMSWEEQGGGNGLSKKAYERKNVRLLDVDDYRSLEEGEIYPESGVPSVRESYFADQDSDPEFSNGWDSIKADVQTPDEIPDIGIQNIRRYLSTSEHNLEDLI